jgi:hypothetical protein
MAANKSINKKNEAKIEVQRSPWQNVFLALSLVPLVAGALLILAWALDWDLIGALENQVYIGILFLLLSFTISNLVQQRWLLFAGWLLLLVADFLFLVWVNPLAQILAGVLGIVGAILIGYRYFQQIASQAEKPK